jgi:hypothetical protein
MFSAPLLFFIQFIVHFVKFEYTINQGVAPTLVYPVPTLESSPVFGRIIHSIQGLLPSLAGALRAASLVVSLNLLG